MEKTPWHDNIPNKLMQGSVIYCTEISSVLTKIFYYILHTITSYYKSMGKLVHYSNYQGAKDEIDNLESIRLISNVYKVVQKVLGNFLTLNPKIWYRLLQQFRIVFSMRLLTTLFKTSCDRDIVHV